MKDLTGWLTEGEATPRQAYLTSAGGPLHRPSRRWYGQVMSGSWAPNVDSDGVDGKRGGVTAIRFHGPAFDENVLLAQVQRLFFAALETWTSLKPALSHGVMASFIWEKQKAQIAAYRESGWRNVLSRLTFTSAVVAGALSDTGFDTVTVRINANSADYDVDASGAVIRGDTNLWELDGRLDLSAPVGGGDRPARDGHVADVSELRRIGQRRHHQHLSLLRCRRDQWEVRLAVDPDRSSLIRVPALIAGHRRRGAPRRTPTSRRFAPDTDGAALRARHRRRGASRRTPTSWRSAPDADVVALDWCATRNSRALSRLANFKGRAPTVLRNARDGRRPNARELRAYTSRRGGYRWELGFSAFSALKTENRPSLSGRFSCPVRAVPAGRRAPLFSHCRAARGRPLAPVTHPLIAPV